MQIDSFLSCGPTNDSVCRTRLPTDSFVVSKVTATEDLQDCVVLGEKKEKQSVTDIGSQN